MPDIGIPSSGQPSVKDGVRVYSGERLSGEMIKADGENAVIRLKGEHYSVKFVGELPETNRFKVEILKTSPQIEVRLLQGSVRSEAGLIKLEGGVLRAGTIVTVSVIKGVDGVFVLRVDGRDFTGTLPAEFAKAGTFNARVVSETPLLLMPERGGQWQAAVNQDKPAAEQLPVTTRHSGELLFLAGKDIAAISKDMARMNISAINSEELRQLIRNSGLFLENKLATDLPVAGDMKLNAGTQGNRAVWDGITRMQLFSILLEDGFFSFFGLDELEGDGVIYARRQRYGTAFYMKMKFTSLGDTVLSIIPLNTGIYSAVVRTERDISNELSAVRIDGASIRWQRLVKKDFEIFDIKNRVVGKLGRFDITV